jgi:hypothetical protein
MKADSESGQIPGPEGALDGGMAPSTSSADFQRRLDLLRDQVDALQVLNSEKKRPWYKNPSTLISIAALTVSTLLGINSLFQKSADELNAKRAQLRDLMSRLLDLEHDYYTRDLLLPDKSLQEDAEFAISKKRDLYLESIAQLEREIGTPLTFREYVVLAGQSTTAQDPAGAEGYYEKARKYAGSRSDRLLGYQYSGNFYFGAGALADPEKGRQFYRDALKVAAEAQGEQSHYDASLVYAAWGESAHSRRLFAEAYEKMSLAVDEVAAISPGHRLRQVGTDNLRDRIDDWVKDGEDFAKAGGLRAKLRVLGLDQFGGKQRPQRGSR